MISPEFEPQLRWLRSIDSVLHAVNRKKARLNAFRGPGLKVPLEDMVTSAIFGPLLFMDQEEAAAAVSLVLAALEIERPDWVGPAHLSLWPKRRTLEHLRSKYVEPDAEIIDVPGTALIIEVKWGSRLSDNELAAQWLALTPEARASSRHVLIVREPHAHYQAAIVRDRSEIGRHCDLPWPVRMVTWRRMADAFRVVAADVSLNPGTRRWALGVHGFLRREDPRALVGWNGLGLEEVGEARWRYIRRLVNEPDELAEVVWRYNEGWFAASGAVQTLEWSYAK